MLRSCICFPDKLYVRSLISGPCAQTGVLIICVTLTPALSRIWAPLSPAVLVQALALAFLILASAGHKRAVTR